MSDPNLIPSLPQTIDPFAPCRPGRYDDYLVSVLHAEPPRPAPWIPVRWSAPSISA